MKEPKIAINHEFLQLIAGLDEFKGKWELLKTMSPERLQQLRKVATIESIGSSTRIEGAKLTDIQIETLLSNLTSTSFKTRDEQEVAGYAEAMDMVFQAYEDLHITENHIRQLHQVLLRHSTKDERHRGAYKTLSNQVVATDEQGVEISIVFGTTTPFDTPREMEELVRCNTVALRKYLCLNPPHSILHEEDSHGPNAGHASRWCTSFRLYECQCNLAVLSA